MQIDITITHNAWENAITQKMIESCLQAAARHLALPETAALSVLLTDNATIQQLNYEYRGKDKPTNVLSFPQELPELLGDIVLAYETIASEAETQGKGMDAHIQHLLIHGLLHLTGHDHEEEAEAEAMEALEIAILSELSVANPYD